MKVIVPLAGPDFVFEDGSVKAEFEVKPDTPLLKWVLDNRSWYRSGYVVPSDFIFVMYDCPGTRNFSSTKLKKWYPGCKVIFISHYTKGAALSALVGVSTIEQLSEEAICIDLADIYYDENVDIDSILVDNEHVGALALIFKHDNPQYSYLELDDDGYAISAREKIVISDNASAGTYFFKNALTYMEALSHCIANASQYEHNGLQFVCPVYNGVVHKQLKVAVENVTNVQDIKIMLQEA